MFHCARFLFHELLRQRTTKGAWQDNGHVEMIQEVLAQFCTGGTWHSGAAGYIPRMVTETMFRTSWSDCEGLFFFTRLRSEWRACCPHTSRLFGDTNLNAGGVFARAHRWLVDPGQWHVRESLLL